MPGNDASASLEMSANTGIRDAAVQLRALALLEAQGLQTNAIGSCGPLG